MSISLINGKEKTQAMPSNAVVSIPPSGKHAVINAYFDPDTGKVVLKVKDNEE